MVAIIFEGKSDEKILNKICKTYKLPIEEIQYFNFEGKDKIFNTSHEYYNEIKNKVKNSQAIDKILIVVDADNKNDSHPHRGFQPSKKILEETITNLDFEIPVYYYIMCDENKQGNLESLLLSVLDDTQKKCIEEFRKCYKYNFPDKLVYNTFYKQKKEPFNFEHKNFNDLKQKLENLFKDN